MELPPPEKIPNFEIGSNVSKDNIFLISLYGTLFAVIHNSFGSFGDCDYLALYALYRHVINFIIINKM
jgi:hypothetical protein